MPRRASSPRLALLLSVTFAAVILYATSVCCLPTSFTLARFGLGRQSVFSVEPASPSSDIQRSPDAWSDQQAGVDVSLLDDEADAERKGKGGWVYLIRHGEKVKAPKPGLSGRGVERSRCLVDVFGRGPHRVDYAMAQKYKADGRRARAYETLKPLSKKMGVPLDTHCDRDDASCVAHKLRSEIAQGHNVVVSWEHRALKHIARKLGVKGLWYPHDRFDVVIAIRNGKVHRIFSEECKGLDEQWFKWRGRKSKSGKGKGGPKKGLIVDDQSWAEGAGED